MPSGTTVVAGIEVPSTSVVFLTMVGIHVLLGLVCVVAGAVAMLSPKRNGRHPLFGTVYFWCLSAVFASAASLAAVRWAEDYHLFILAFYVDNGKNLPLWKELPPLAFWLLPTAVGIPVVVYALLRHPFVRAAAQSGLRAR